MCKRLFHCLTQPEVTSSLGCSLTLLTNCVGSHQSAEGRGLWRPKTTPREWPSVCPCPNTPSACLPLRQTSQLPQHYSSVKPFPSLRALWRSNFAANWLPLNISPTMIQYVCDFFPLRGLLGPSALMQCAVLLFCLCCNCGGWCPPLLWFTGILYVCVCVWMCVSCQIARWSMPGCGVSLVNAVKTCMTLSQIAPNTHFVTVIYFFNGYKWYVWL